MINNGSLQEKCLNRVNLLHHVTAILILPCESLMIYIDLHRLAYLFVPNVMASVVVVWQSENQLSLHSHSQLTNNLIQTTITVWSITTIALCTLENTQFVLALTNKTIKKYEIISVAILSLLFKWQQQRIVEARRRISLQRHDRTSKVAKMIRCRKIRSPGTKSS